MYIWGYHLRGTCRLTPDNQPRSVTAVKKTLFGAFLLNQEKRKAENSVVEHHSRLDGSEFGEATASNQEQNQMEFVVRLTLEARPADGKATSKPLSFSRLLLYLIPPGLVNEYQLRLGRQMQVWFIPLADVRGVCRYNCEIPRERMPYLSALEVWSRQGAIQINVYFTLLYLMCLGATLTLALLYRHRVSSHRGQNLTFQWRPTNTRRKPSRTRVVPVSVLIPLLPIPSACHKALVVILPVVMHLLKRLLTRFRKQLDIWTCLIFTVNFRKL